MARESGLPPAAAGEIVWIGCIALKRRQLLPAHSLDRIRIKTRTPKREAQQIEGLVTMFIQSPQGTVKVVPPDLEGHFDCVVFQPLVKILAIDIVGAFIEHVGGKM